MCRFRKRELRGRIGIGIGIGDVEKAANVNTVDVDVDVDVEIDVLRQARLWTSICFIYLIYLISIKNQKSKFQNMIINQSSCLRHNMLGHPRFNL